MALDWPWARSFGTACEQYSGRWSSARGEASGRKGMRQLCRPTSSDAACRRRRPQARGGEQRISRCTGRETRLARPGGKGHLPRQAGSGSPAKGMRSPRATLGLPLHNLCTTSAFNTRCVTQQGHPSASRLRASLMAVPVRSPAVAGRLPHVAVCGCCGVLREAAAMPSHGYLIPCNLMPCNCPAQNIRGSTTPRPG